MKRLLALAAVVCGGAGAAAAAPPPKPFVTGLQNPAAVAVAADGRVFVAVAGEPGAGGKGAVLVVRGGKAVPFAGGLDDPKGLLAWQGFLLVTDRRGVWRLDPA